MDLKSKNSEFQTTSRATGSREEAVMMMMVMKIIIVQTLLPSVSLLLSSGYNLVLNFWQSYLPLTSLYGSFAAMVTQFLRRTYHHFLLVPGSALSIPGFDLAHFLVLWVQLSVTSGNAELGFIACQMDWDKDSVVEFGWEKQMACLVRMEEGYGG